MLANSQHPTDRTRELDDARRAQRTIFTLGRDHGAQTSSRPAFRGSHSTVPDLEPLAGLRAARNLELGAQHAASDYIRAAREAARTWHDIGTAPHLTTGSNARGAGESIAEAAYAYAAGSRDTDSVRRYGRSFVWTCHSCDHTISDQGVCNGPTDDEHGHASGCRRLAATIAAWDAEWDSDWEAGE